MKVSLTVLPDPTGFPGVLAAVRAAAGAGFPRAWFPQLPPTPEMIGWDALTTLALAGAAVPHIELGSAVVVAQTQHPLALARQALTASAAIGGRLILGIGVSHRFLVSDMFGYPYEAPAAYLREYLEVLVPALRGDAVDHHGARITAVGQLALPGAPAPSVMAAALGPRMLDLAGELTDGTLTTWTGIKALEGHIVPRIGAAAQRYGRPSPQVVVGLPVCVTDDVAAARAEITGMFDPGDLPAYRAMLDREGVDDVADICVFGDEVSVLAQLRRFAQAGATEFSGFAVGDPQTQARTAEVLAAYRD